MIRAEAELAQHFPRRAGMAEFVVHADAAHRRRALLRKHARNGLAQTADDAVLFAGDHLTTFLRRLDDDLLIQRLDGADIDHAGVDALFRQRPRRNQRLVNHQAGRDNRHIVALSQLLALADFKMILFLIVEHRDRQTAKAQVHRAVVGVGRLDRRAGFHIVRRAEHDHAGDGAHQREILAALVGSAVLADGNAAVRRADFHVQVGIADGVAHLLERAPRRKHRKRGSERNQPHRGQTRRNGDHVRLRNAAVKMTIRENLAEHARLRSGGEVGVQHDEVAMFAAQLDQRLAIALAGRDLLHFAHVHASNSAIAARSSLMATSYSASLGALPCQSTLFSM